jgi:hypothetical protein
MRTVDLTSLQGCIDLRALPEEELWLGQGLIQGDAQLLLEKPSSLLYYELGTATDPWMRPRSAHEFEQLTPSFLLIAAYPGNYLALLAPQGERTFFKAGTGGPQLRADTKGPADAIAFLALRHRALDPLLRQLFASAQFHACPYPSLFPPIPSWMEKLGIHIAPAPGIPFNHSYILNACKSFTKTNYCASYVLIEGGWQSQNFFCFEADPERFPQGLKGLVGDLKALGLSHVGLGHYLDEALWSLAKDKPEGIFAFYCDYYSFLRCQGVDFVFVEGQESLPWEKASSLYRAAAAASSLYFQQAPIYLTGLEPSSLFGAPPALFRAADKKAELANPLGAAHLVRNGLCHALWLQHLSRPFFGSLKLEGESKELLAIFHALSGSCLCVEAPCETLPFLKHMALEGGQCLQADAPLCPCPATLFENPLESRQPFKAHTRKGLALVIALFNLLSGKRPVHGSVSALDSPHYKEGRYAVYSYLHGFLGACEGKRQFQIYLKAGQADIYTFVPIEEGIALLGCCDFFLLGGSVIEAKLEADTFRIWSMLAAPLLLYVEKQVLQVRRDGHLIPYNYDRERNLLQIEHRSQRGSVPVHYAIQFV